MESEIEAWSSNSVETSSSVFSSSNDRYSRRMRKRNQTDLSFSSLNLGHNKRKFPSRVVDYSDPFDLCNLEQGLDLVKYGCVANDILDLVARRKQALNKSRTQDVSSSRGTRDVGRDREEDDNASVHLTPAKPNPTADTSHSSPIIILDSDDEVNEGEKPSSPNQGDLSKNIAQDIHQNDIEDLDTAENQLLLEGASHCSDESEKKKDKGVYLGVEDDESEKSDSDEDGVGDIWKEMMTQAMGYLEDARADASSESHASKNGEEDCDHSFILKDDIGTVCRICGIIKQSIDTIIDLQFVKAKKNTRTYTYEERKRMDQSPTDTPTKATKPSEEFQVAEVSAHPRHKKLMKPHQTEGFDFLIRNLVTDNPRGCILAHAPGSGKTFMIISFLQSFMAKYPDARPLVVLPKGILATWKKEFKRWQVEDLPLYDFYSANASNRSQQLEVLKHWSAERSILFLGYKQFSTIVCDMENTNAAVECREILLTCPSILILDEGHTPRNEETDTLSSLEKVETPRKVVLSGTLYQNSVREVFNILNLVQPRFLEMDTSKAVKIRILSRASISGRHSHIKNVSDKDFYAFVEQTLLDDNNSSMKDMIIRDLREMTHKVLHYYKGEFLEELPGLVDFTVFLKLHQRQRTEVAELNKQKQKFKFKVSSDGSAIYVHPELNCLTGSKERERLDEKRIDAILEDLDMREGVKAKFYLNLLQLCESSGEKLLVFSQYLLPLKFLERLTIKLKGYTVGKHIFGITGDLSSSLRESIMEQFNTSADARVFFGSIKACGEGISLVGASRVLVLDVPLNPSVTRQAIGRAFRPGQERKVYTYRLVALDSPEVDDYHTCFQKELIAKRWFEWNGYDSHFDFKMEEIDIKKCGDMFLETPRLSEDVASLYKR